MDINVLVVWKQGGDTWHRDNLELSSIILLSLVGQAQWWSDNFSLTEDCPVLRLNCRSLKSC